MNFIEKSVGKSISKPQTQGGFHSIAIVFMVRQINQSRYLRGELIRVDPVFFGKFVFGDFLEKEIKNKIDFWGTHERILFRFAIVVMLDIGCGRRVDFGPLVLKRHH